METPDILIALKPVVKTLEELAIPYYIGGSIASSIYGMPRATMDVDLVADIQHHHVLLLRHKLEKEYYIDEDTIQEAIDRGSSFNLVHLETAIKIDIFIRKNDPYQEMVQRRKIKDTFLDNDASTEFYFSSPEDVILIKLQWYETGGRVSERQWLDIVGVIKVQRDILDKNYLNNWSKKLGISELLIKAFSHAGVHLS